MNLVFKELSLDWPTELSVFDLKDYILSEITKHGQPLRWAITSVDSHAKKNIQVISVEVVLIIYQEKEREVHSEFRLL